MLHYQIINILHYSFLSIFKRSYLIYTSMLHIRLNSVTTYYFVSVSSYHILLLIRILYIYCLIIQLVFSNQMIHNHSLIQELLTYINHMLINFACEFTYQNFDRPKVVLFEIIVLTYVCCSVII